MVVERGTLECGMDVVRSRASAREDVHLGSAARLLCFLAALMSCRTLLVRRSSILKTRDATHSWQAVLPTACEGSVEASLSPCCMSA